MLRDVDFMPWTGNSKGFTNTVTEDPETVIHVFRNENIGKDLQRDSRNRFGAWGLLYFEE